MLFELVTVPEAQRGYMVSHGVSGKRWGFNPELFGYDSYFKVRLETSLIPEHLLLRGKNEERLELYREPLGWGQGKQHQFHPQTEGEKEGCAGVFSHRWLESRVSTWEHVCMWGRVHPVKWVKKGTWRVVIPDPWWKSVWKSGLNFEDQFTYLRNNPEKWTLVFKEMSRSLPWASVILQAGCSGACVQRSLSCSWRVLAQESWELSVQEHRKRLDILLVVGSILHFGNL